MKHPWPDMKWWDSGERQVVEEKIDDLEHAGIRTCPPKAKLYTALRRVPEAEVKVAIIGQDPYPTPGVATGVAFSVDKEMAKANWPHTLRIILGEYHSDLGYPIPNHGDLSRWCSQGVLLWNAIPSCQPGRPLSNDWDEWDYLTGEIIERLSKKGIVFAFLGTVGARHADKVDLSRNRVIRTSHPSPRGIRSSKTPFTGSRIFSTINARLTELKLGRIEWRLDDDPENNLPSTPAVRGNLLQNINNVQLGGLPTVGTSPNIYTSLLF